MIKTYINFAFDELGFPHEDENPKDIEHIAEYLEAKDTATSQEILEKYPVLFKDPVVLNVINLCRAYLITPPQELLREEHRYPVTDPTSASTPTSADPTTTASNNPLFGSLISSSHASNPSNPITPTLTDQKLITILASIADGSLTSLGYDYKTHQTIVETPDIDQRINAIKLLSDLANRTTQSATQAVQIINDITLPPPPADLPIDQPDIEEV